MALLAKLAGGEVQAVPTSPLNLVPSNVAAVLKDGPVGGGRSPQENGLKEATLISFIEQRWTRAVQYRRPYEQLWLDSHRNYRGLYGPDVAFTSTEKSRIFIRVTKTKVNAAFGQIMDVLFSDDQFPIAIEPSNLPDGVKDTESVETSVNTEKLYKDHADNSETENSQSAPQQPSSNALKYGFPGDGTRENEKPASDVAAQAFVGPLGKNETVHDGPPQSPTAVEIDPAMLSAKKMQKLIQDQLHDCSGDKHLRHAAFECVNLGTGCIKGPIAVADYIAELDENGQPYSKTIKRPKIEAVSIWDIYPDTDANSVETCDYIIQRHKLSISQLRALKIRPGFRANEIDILVAGGFNYLRQWWEPMLQDMPMVQPVEKYEVLEYNGMIDKVMALEFGISEKDIPVELRDADELPCNIWLSGHRVLRLIINPFNNGRWPYYLIPFEIQPYVIWGIGVSETMSDTQALMNGFMRLAVDNAVLSGNMVFEIDESMLVAGQNYDLYPGKFFRKMGGAQGQAIYPHEFPNTAAANMQLYDKARELADEATFPSFTHGNTSINPSLGRTSSGLSMMMGAASVSIRMSVKNFDDYLLTPLGEALFEFNKLNTDDDELKGNFEVQAGGTDILMRNEIKSQRLISFIQLLENPLLAPFAKWPYLIREAADLLDLDPDKCTNTGQEAMRMADLLQQMQPPPPAGQQMPPKPQHGLHQKGSPAAPKDKAAANPNAGQVALPGETSFSANKG